MIMVNISTDKIDRSDLQCEKCEVQVKILKEIVDANLRAKTIKGICEMTGLPPEDIDIIIVETQCPKCKEKITKILNYI